jgi:predicted Zn-dependent protease
MSRIESLRKLHEEDPADVDLLFMIGSELFKDGKWTEAIEWLTRYAEAGQDVGAGYGLIAECWEQLGREDEARVALRRGMEAARAAGHPTMAGDFANRLEDMD